ncbi:hypothetical protein JCM10550A_02890 [Methanogenium cariaci]|jgi:hypothetical protein
MGINTVNGGLIFRDCFGERVGFGTMVSSGMGGSPRPVDCMGGGGDGVRFWVVGIVRIIRVPMTVAFVVISDEFNRAE